MAADAAAAIAFFPYYPSTIGWATVAEEGEEKVLADVDVAKPCCLTSGDCLRAFVRVTAVEEEARAVAAVVVVCSGDYLLLPPWKNGLSHF